MEFNERIKLYRNHNSFPSWGSLARYCKVSESSILKLIKGHQVTEKIAWAVFMRLEGYVSFEELTPHISSRYKKRLERKNAKALMSKYKKINELRFCPF